MEKTVQSWHRRLVFFHHLISLFALASTSGGIVTPICFAVFILITNSNLIGYSIPLCKPVSAHTFNNVDAGLPVVLRFSEKSRRDYRIQTVER